jgi:hypothetical protein
VLLDNAVKQFHDCIGRFGEHSVAAGLEVYIQPSVYLSLHLVSMRTAGWQVDFDELAAVSGASALFAYKPGDFMPKYAHLHISPDGRIAEATGFGYEWLPFDGVSGAWDLLTESVGAGRPLKGWHWENLLLAGYQDAPAEAERKIFVAADGPGTFAGWIGWNEFASYIRALPRFGRQAFGRHTTRVESHPAEEVAHRVLEDLILFSDHPPAELTSKYPGAVFGLDAIEAYARDCADMTKFEDWTPCHDVNGQWAVRNSTAAYLSRLASTDLFTPPVRDSLRTAATHYRAAYQSWKELYRLLGHRASDDSGKTPELRASGAGAVRTALEQERIGLRELSAALRDIRPSASLHPKTR